MHGRLFDASTAKSLLSITHIAKGISRPIAQTVTLVSTITGLRISKLLRFLLVETVPDDGLLRRRFCVGSRVRGQWEVVRGTACWSALHVNGLGSNSRRTV